MSIDFAQGQAAHLVAAGLGLIAGAVYFGVNMGLLSLAFISIPFIPWIRDIPRRVPMYRLIWREHYRSPDSPPTAS